MSVRGPSRAQLDRRRLRCRCPAGCWYVLLVRQVEPERGEAAAPDVAIRDGARSYSVTLDGGRTLTVISMSGMPGQPAPLAHEVPDLARELANHL